MRPRALSGCTRGEAAASLLRVPGKALASALLMAQRCRPRPVGARGAATEGTPAHGARPPSGRQRAGHRGPCPESCGASDAAWTPGRGSRRPRRARRTRPALGLSVGRRALHCVALPVDDEAVPPSGACIVCQLGTGASPEVLPGLLATGPPPTWTCAVGLRARRARSSARGGRPAGRWPRPMFHGKHDKSPLVWSESGWHGSSGRSTRQVLGRGSAGPGRRHRQRSGGGPRRRVPGLRRVPESMTPRSMPVLPPAHSASPPGLRRGSPTPCWKNSSQPPQRCSRRRRLLDRSRQQDTVKRRRHLPAGPWPPREKVGRAQAGSDVVEPASSSEDDAWRRSGRRAAVALGPVDPGLVGGAPTGDRCAPLTAPYGTVRG